MDSARATKSHNAWLKAYREISDAYQDDGPPWPVVNAYAPGLAQRIDMAEEKAEAASVAFIAGGPGGVQTQINEWRDLWLEAIELLRGVPRAG